MIRPTALLLVALLVSLRCEVHVAIAEETNEVWWSSWPLRRSLRGWSPFRSSFPANSDEQSNAQSRPQRELFGDSITAETLEHSERRMPQSDAADPVGLQLNLSGGGLDSSENGVDLERPLTSPEDVDKQRGTGDSFFDLDASAGSHGRPHGTTTAGPGDGSQGDSSGVTDGSIQLATSTSGGGRAHSTPADGTGDPDNAPLAVTPEDGSDSAGEGGGQTIKLGESERLHSVTMETGNPPAESAGGEGEGLSIQLGESERVHSVTLDGRSGTGGGTLSELSNEGLAGEAGPGTGGGAGEVSLPPEGSSNGLAGGLGASPQQPNTQDGESNGGSPVQMSTGSATLQQGPPEGGETGSGGTGANPQQTDSTQDREGNGGGPVQMSTGGATVQQGSPGGDGTAGDGGGAAAMTTGSATVAQSGVPPPNSAGTQAETGGGSAAMTTTTATVIHGTGDNAGTQAETGGGSGAMTTTAATVTQEIGGSGGGTDESGGSGSAVVTTGAATVTQANGGNNSGGGTGESAVGGSAVVTTGSATLTQETGGDGGSEAGESGGEGPAVGAAPGDGPAAPSGGDAGPAESLGPPDQLAGSESSGEPGRPPDGGEPAVPVDGGEEVGPDDIIAEKIDPSVDFQPPPGANPEGKVNGRGAELIQRPVLSLSHVCGRYSGEATRACRILPVCKYEKDANGGVTSKMIKGQGACARRCDPKQFNMGEGHCGEGESCFDDIENCLCPDLSEPGCEPF